MPEVKKWVTLGIQLVLKVSRYGSGLYMRIPTEIAESLGLKPGTQVQVKLVKKAKPENPGMRPFLKTVASPGAEGAEGGEKAGS